MIGVATRYEQVELGRCLAIAEDPTAIGGGECPGFVLAALRDVVSRCSEAGGHLEPSVAPIIWSMDIEADGDPEYLMDVTENYVCDGAPGVLSCGSLGCGASVWAREGDDWIVLGRLDSGHAEGAEVLAAPPGSSHGSFRGGCSGRRPCDEVTYFAWDGSTYVSSVIDVRGDWVDVAPAGLWTLTRGATLRSRPSASAGAVDDYPAGTDVVVIGDARDAPYRYVSPCNACDRGFIEDTALRRGASR